MDLKQLEYFVNGKSAMVWSGIWSTANMTINGLMPNARPITRGIITLVSTN